MINVKIWFIDESISKIEVKGHAEYARSGKDLICAGVSSIMFGLMNALDSIGKDNMINQGDNVIIITVDDLKNKKIQDYMELVIVQLETIAESYPEYIQTERS